VSVHDAVVVLIVISVGFIALLVGKSARAAANRRSVKRKVGASRYSLALEGIRDEAKGLARRPAGEAVADFRLMQLFTRVTPSNIVLYPTDEEKERDAQVFGYAEWQQTYPLRRTEDAKWSFQDPWTSEWFGLPEKLVSAMEAAYLDFSRTFEPFTESEKRVFLVSPALLFTFTSRGEPLPFDVPAAVEQAVRRRFTLLSREAAGSKKLPVLSELTTGKYRVGQTWQFNARPGEENATLTIVRVESSPLLGVIVHVSLSGLRIASPQAPGGFTDALAHAPFSEAAIEKSVTALVGENRTLPAFEESYRLWRNAFDEGNGGIFTITVATAVRLAEEGLKKG
jgi:hypothetical protein